MLKILFWSLVLANAALFALHRGYLGALIPDGREPARMAGQFNADRIKLIAPPEPGAGAKPAAAAAPAAEPVLARQERETIACTEIGNFDAAEARRFETRLAASALGGKLSRRSVADAERHMVYIGAQGSKEAADKKAGELRQLGIDDFYVIQDDGELRWGISLGVFKTEEAARAHLLALTRKGVRSARLGTRSASSTKVAFQLRELDADALTRFDKIKSDFPRQETRACEPA